MGLSSAERGKQLENAQGIASIHKEFALEGQTGVSYYFMCENSRYL